MEKQYTHREGVVWNSRVKLIVSDVDDTVAAVYRKAVPEMIKEFESLLEEGKSIFLVTGAGLQSVRDRITELVRPVLRRGILMAVCHGAELWGYAKDGKIANMPYYSIYDNKFTPKMRTDWRKAVKRLVEEFELKTFPTMPTSEFKEKTNDPLSIMLADRGPQITFEMVNASRLTPAQAKGLEDRLEIGISLTNDAYDLRYTVAARAKQLFEEAGLPLKCTTGGDFALDFTIDEVSKTQTIKYVLNNGEILRSLGLKKEDVVTHTVEMWGDKFMANGYDFLMSLAFPRETRSIDFRREDPAKLAPDYNIQLWPGKKRLCEGLLEYLQSKAT